MQKVIHNLDEMDVFAGQILENVRGGEVVFLYGELGSGKTAFVQSLAKKLGVEQAVTSPTFTVVGEYPVDWNGISALVHVDLYRLAVDTARGDPAVQDVLERSTQPDRLTVIEWADRLGDYTVSHAHSIRFAHGSDKHERIVEVL